MDNKYITIALVAAICVSLGGTFITLNKLSELSETQVTGFAISDSGQGRIEILKQVSIVVNSTGYDGSTDGSDQFHNDIFFGECAPDVINSAKFNLTSNSSSNHNAFPALGNCTLESSFPDYIHVYNIGNVDANITLKTSLNSTDFIQSALNDALFGYKTTDGDSGPTNGTRTHRGGCRQCESPLCAGTAPSNVTQWTSFRGNSGAVDYIACNNLTHTTSGVKPSFKTYLFVQVPATAIAQVAPTVATLTYTAEEVS